MAGSCVVTPLARSEPPRPTYPSNHEQVPQALSSNVEAEGGRTRIKGIKGSCVHVGHCHRQVNTALQQATYQASFLEAQVGGQTG
jgi:hypothetical protein